MNVKIILLVSLLAAEAYACQSNGPSQVSAKKQIAASNGQVLFEQKCAPCHGSDGTAGIGHAANLQVSSMDRNAINHSITEGKGSMPAFKQQLSEKEIADLSAYVVALRNVKN